MSKKRVLVLGAGLSGMSFALHYDKSILILEKENTHGGLVRTMKSNGYCFDLAPHLIHLRNEYVKDLLFNKLNLKLNKISRVSNIYFEDRIIQYPFELHLSQVSKKVREECLSGLDSTTNFSEQELIEIKKSSYSDYVINCFGQGIGNHYLLPYNQKIWTIRPSEMTCEWMKFLPTANKEQIRKSSEIEYSANFGYNTEFYYPFNNGIQELPDSIAKELENIVYNAEIVKINTNDKVVYTLNGKEYNYDILISTLPLKNLVLISDLEMLKQEALQLKHTTIYIINVVIEGLMESNYNWSYFPDPKHSFYRISYPKSYFKKSTPNDNEIILSIEVASNDSNCNVQELNNNVIDQIKELKFINISRIKFIDNYKIPVAYPIYDFNRTRIVNKIQNELNKFNIISTGRFGYWDYSAMEDAILYGKHVAENLK